MTSFEKREVLLLKGAKSMDFTTKVKEGLVA